MVALSEAGILPVIWAGFEPSEETPGGELGPSARRKSPAQD